MAELAVAESLTAETRAKLDSIEQKGRRTSNAKSAPRRLRSKPKSPSSALRTRVTWPPGKIPRTANAPNFAAK